MKNLYPEAIKKLVLFRKNLIAVILNWSNSLKEDFSFYNNHTELLAIWTILFTTITGLFVLAIKSNILIMFLFFILAVIVMFAGTTASAYYLYSLEYQNRERLLPRIHRLLNKSFKLRNLFNSLRIPRISILNNITKSFKLAS